MKKVTKIAITGKIGSGKTTLCNIVKEIGDGFSINNVLFKFNNLNNMKIRDSLFSPSYGKAQMTKSVVVSLDGTSTDYKISYN